MQKPYTTDLLAEMRKIFEAKNERFYFYFFFRKYYPSKEQ